MSPRVSPDPTKGKERKVSRDLIRRILHIVQDAGKTGVLRERICTLADTSDRQLIAAIQAIRADGGVLRERAVPGTTAKALVLDKLPDGASAFDPAAGLVLSLLISQGLAPSQVDPIQTLIAEGMGTGDRRRMATFKDSLVERSGAGEDSIAGILDTAITGEVLDALGLPRRRLSLTYRSSSGEGAPKRHEVSPYRLVHDQLSQAVYLIALDHGNPDEPSDKPRKRLVPFALHRVLDAQVLDQAAAREPSGLEPFVKNMIAGWGHEGEAATADITILKGSWITTLQETVPDLPCWVMDAHPGAKTAAASFNYPEAAPNGAQRWIANLIPFVRVDGPAPLQERWLGDLSKSLLDTLAVAPEDLRESLLQGLLPKLQALRPKASKNPKGDTL